ncbi:orotidine-5'-phosphate decarboxylase [Kytococcus schroeteri]|uniref:Orotidine-5'-phosphate decarboxylase n=2 Tax=Kytococcus TaxID=57499 RepID=A0A2I1P9W9_9MICO|nr:orotidine-5'-phosphate decarboxylase [Kytococcus schroeteri]PKZ41429.1 orotidine-5'-phosphate decarboxylase [Kytococcus schroeteri]
MSAGAPAGPGLGARLRQAVAAHGRLCAGIDPHPSLLRDLGLGVDPAGLATFAERCVAAFAGRVAVVKPQVSFFEAFGSRGIAVLEDTMAALREAGALVLLDAKRGDIGSTNAAYARAWFGEGAPLRCDAVTLSPYLGEDALRGVVEAARADGAGAFVLCRTSNPEAGPLQGARRDDGLTVAAGVARWAEQFEGDVGLVVGITVRDALETLPLAGGAAPLLAPGFGAQGGSAADLRGVFGDESDRVLASVSRDLLRHAGSVETLVQAVEGWQRELTAGEGPGR